MGTTNRDSSVLTKQRAQKALYTHYSANIKNAGNVKQEQASAQSAGVVADRQIGGSACLCTAQGTYPFIGDAGANNGANANH